MTSVGYSVEEVPMVMSTSCFDQTAATDAGASAEGIYFVGSPSFLTQDPATLEGDEAEQATLYQEKVIEYGLPEDLMTRNFAQQGFIMIMSMVQRAAEVAAADEQVDGQTLADAFAATEGSPQFGGTGISCASASAPYLSVCNDTIAVTQWNGESRTPWSRSTPRSSSSRAPRSAPPRWISDSARGKV